MRRLPGRYATVLAAAAALACAAPLAAQQDSTAHAPAAPAPRRHDYFSACPGQEPAMALLAGRPQARRRAHAMPEVVRIRIRVGSMPLGSAGPTQDNPGRTVSYAKDMELRLRVDAEGRVQQVEILQGTGEPMMDPHIVDMARDQRFDPATETAFPVPGCAIQKVMIRG